MRKIYLSLLVFAVSGAAFAAGLKLLEEFDRRDQLKLTAQQGTIIDFLEDVKYNKSSIQQLENLKPAAWFVFRDRNNVICLGNTVAMSLRCLNELGLREFFFNDKEATDVVAAVGEQSSVLYEEFKERALVQWTPEAKEIIDFLRGIGFAVGKIVEFDLVATPADISEFEKPPKLFVLRERDGDICFGDAADLMIRCKNEMGITGISYQGDGD